MRLTLLLAILGLSIAAALPHDPGPALYAKTQPTVVQIINGNIMGSGAFITGDGHILTCAHLFDEDKPVKLVLLVLADGTMQPADVVGIDFDHDLALLKAYPQKGSFPHAHLGKDAVVGQEVYVVGHPFNLAWTMTKGIISGQNRMKQKLLQTDAVINSGNSGGPVFNKSGEIVGVAEAIFPLPVFVGQGLCISGPDIRRFLSHYILRGI